MSRAAIMCQASRSLILPQPKRVAHSLVRDVASQMAAAVYEASAHDNRFYAAFPNMQGFVDATWQQMIPAARDQLVDMLTMDSISQGQKDAIMEALVLDGGLQDAATRGTINDANAPKPERLR